MELNQAKVMSTKILNTLRPHSIQAEVVGSVRRDLEDVHDIDIVAIPASPSFFTAMNTLGVATGGPRSIRSI